MVLVTMYSDLFLEAWCFIIRLTSTGVSFLAKDIYVHMHNHKILAHSCPLLLRYII